MDEFRLEVAKGRSATAGVNRIEMQNATLPKAPPTLAQERVGIAAVALVAAKKNLIWEKVRRRTSAWTGISNSLTRLTEQQGDWSVFRSRAVHRSSRTKPMRLDIFTQNQSTEDTGSAIRCQYSLFYILRKMTFLIGLMLDKRCGVPNNRPRRTSQYRRPISYNPQSQNGLFKTTGVSADSFTEDVGTVLNLLLQARSQNGSFPVSWFELFTYGLTNLCRSLYFGMDLALNAAEFNLHSEGSEFGVGVGPQEHEFLFAYVKFLVTQHLAEINYADYLIDWEDRELQPKFVAPLTSRGRQLKQMISDEEDRLVASGALKTEGGSRVAQEGYFEMVEYTYSRRMGRIRRFQELAKVRFAKR